MIKIRELLKKFPETLKTFDGNSYMRQRYNCSKKRYLNDTVLSLSPIYFSPLRFLWEAWGTLFAKSVPHKPAQTNQGRTPGEGSPSFALWEGKGISPSADGDKGYAPLTRSLFEKSDAKTLSLSAIIFPNKSF